MKKYFLFFIFLFFQLTFSQEKNFNVVFDVTSSDIKTHQITVRHLELMSKSYPNSKFEVVLYGGSIEMALDKKSIVKESILVLSQKDNVEFIICEASMRKHKVTKSDLVKGFKTVPDGILEIVEKQIQGWGYIKEAH
jgi:intracellular sulfur oxidation DsrE/DsrF family protein